MRQLSRIQKDALTAWKSWNEENFKAVQSAAGDVYRASVFVRQQGLLALEEFETESELFQWSLAMVIDGTDPAYLEELLENRYFTGQFSSVEKCIYYLYARGSMLIQYGINEQLLQEFLVSIVPDRYRDRLRAFINTCKEETKNTLYQEAEKRAKEFFKNQDMSVLNTEDRKIKTEFDTVFQSMPDRSIQRVLREIETCVFEAAVLYADETTRIRIRTNLSHRLYQYIVEDWEFMYNDHDRSIESMQTMLEVCRKLQDSGEIIVPECKNSRIDVSIYSKKELAACKELPENTVIISFHDPLDSDSILLGSSLSTHSIFSISLEDIDFDDLTDSGIPYADFFPEADALAEFIYAAYTSSSDIICQCEYGQSRSAGCAAAILEHFYHTGITVFTDYQYYPNRVVYHKVLDALEHVKNFHRKVGEN